MAPESLITLDVELWSQFEEGIEIPRPLRIIKRSGTYTAADGSIGLSEGALIIPRRRSSRTISTSTISAHAEGPFGCLTIHKKRGRGMSSSLMMRSPSRDYRIGTSTDQLLDDLIMAVSSGSSDWIFGPQEAEFPGLNAAQSSVLFHPQHFATLPTHSAQCPSPLRFQDHPRPSLSSSRSFPHSSQPSESPSFFKRSLSKFRQSSYSRHRGLAANRQPALRDLVNTPHLQRSTDDHSNAPLRLKENLRRSSTVASITDIFRKLSASASLSSRSTEPLKIHISKPNLTYNYSMEHLNIQAQISQEVIGSGSLTPPVEALRGDSFDILEDPFASPTTRVRVNGRAWKDDGTKNFSSQTFAVEDCGLGRGEGEEMEDEEDEGDEF